MIEIEKEYDMSKCVIVCLFSIFILMVPMVTYAVPEGVDLLFMQDDNSKSGEFIKYSITQEQFDSLSIWNPQYASDNDIRISLDKLLEVALKDITGRMSVVAERAQLERVVLDVADKNGKRMWYFVVTYNINTASNPYYPSPHDFTTVNSVILLNGAVVNSSPLDPKMKAALFSSEWLVNGTAGVNPENNGLGIADANDAF